jgi:hypothetical protein
MQDVPRPLRVARETPKLLLVGVAKRIVKYPDIVPRLSLVRRQREGPGPLVQQSGHAGDVRTPLVRDASPGRQHHIARCGRTSAVVRAHSASPRIMLSMRRVGPTRAATIATLSALAVSTGFISVGSTTAK